MGRGPCTSGAEARDIERLAAGLKARSILYAHPEILPCLRALTKHLRFQNPFLMCGDVKYSQKGHVSPPHTAVQRQGPGSSEMTATLSSHASIGRNLCSVFIIVIVFSTIANAQDRTSIPAPSTAAKLFEVDDDSPKATPARPIDPKAPLIDELERMRARISELEAQLRANDVKSSST